MDDRLRDPAFDRLFLQHPVRLFLPQPARLPPAPLPAVARLPRSQFAERRRAAAAPTGGRRPQLFEGMKLPPEIIKMPKHRRMAALEKLKRKMREARLAGGGDASDGELEREDEHDRRRGSLSADGDDEAARPAADHPATGSDTEDVDVESVGAATRAEKRGAAAVHERGAARSHKRRRR